VGPLYILGCVGNRAERPEGGACRAAVCLAAAKNARPDKTSRGTPPTGTGHKQKRSALKPRVKSRVGVKHPPYGYD